MRKFNVSVNGKSYSVEVEEVGGAPSAPVSAAPVAATAPAAAPAAAPKAPVAAGGKEVTSPMPGAIRKLAVADGATVKAGQSIVVLEAMKMENDIVATADGVIAYNVKVGDNVETGAVLAYIK